ncbi:MAG: hypothetical protein CVU98_00705 [Firmicutes bacterium HGW-Firmicutes-3]|jgi:hypothetical protein|nr:MAG: hypothetical protein CVU98_00705 [Firmicutes bacterium HGW-Firmicutes-3]
MKKRIKKSYKRKDSFLVDMWEFIFRLLGYVSLFFIVKKIKRNISHRFVDFWVIGNFMFAIISSILVYYISDYYLLLKITLSVYGFLRVFEVIIYQINVVLFDPYRSQKSGEKYRVKSIRRIILALFHNYIEIMFWFATIMSTIAVISSVTINATWIEYITSTILCVAIFDRSGIESIIEGNMSIITQLVFLEIVSGLIMTIISIARFIGILPSVDEIDG